MNLTTWLSSQVGMERVEKFTELVRGKVQSSIAVQVLRDCECDDCDGGAEDQKHISLRINLLPLAACFASATNAIITCPHRHTDAPQRTTPSPHLLCLHKPAILDLESCTWRSRANTRLLPTHFRASKIYGYGLGKRNLRSRLQYGSKLRRPDQREE